MPDTEELPTLAQPEEKPEAALERVQGMRMAYSAPRAAQLIAESMVYESFVFGDAPELGGGDEKQSADEKKMGKGWDSTTIPLHGVLRQVLHPTLLSREPTWVNRARPGSDDKEKARGKIYEELAKVIYRENDVHREASAALDDAMLMRCGWFVVDYDDKRGGHGLPRIRWVNARNVLVDRENARSPFTRDQRWWAEFRTISIADAEYLADKEWGNKDYKFTPVKTDVDEALDLDGIQLLDGNGDPLRRVNQRPTEFTRLAYVYIKGANPYGGKPNNNAKPGSIVEKGGEDAVYKGKDELLILECVGNVDLAESYKYVGRKDWPFPCDPGECPAEPLRITADNRDFFPYSIYQPGHALQVAANWALRYYNTDVFNSSRRLILYSDGTLDEKALNTALYGVDNLPALKVKKMGLDRNFKIETFGQPNGALKEAIPANIQQYRDATGLDSIDMEARSNRTATDAALLNQGAQVRTGFMADQMEYTLANVMRKALQCARWNMSAEDVAHWIGEEFLAFEDVKLTRQVEELDGTILEVPTGETVRITALWNDEVKDPASIRDEIGIDVEPRSVRFVNAETEIQDILTLYTKLMESHKRIAEATTPQDKMLIAESSNAMLKMVAERMHIANVHEILYDLTALAQMPPTPEQMQAQAAMTGAMQPGGPVTPQAEGAAGRVAGGLGLANPLQGAA